MAESAEDYLREVEARAKELYASSDQGPWEALPVWMQRTWISQADREIQEKRGGTPERRKPER